MLRFVKTIGLTWVMIMINSSVASPSIGKPGCQTSCGGVSIPFPFGIGPKKCFISEWFEIVCNSSTIPFLKLTNLQVLSISLQDHNVASHNVIQVNNPIAFWNCPKKKTLESLNLTESPFSLSVSDNIFTAVSCDVQASLWSSDLDGGGELLTGCKSMCPTTKKHRDNSCSGVNCCQTTIPSYMIKTFNITFQPTGSKTDQACNYAFVANHSWLNNISDFSDIVGMGYVPVILRWSLNDYQKQLVFDNSTSCGKGDSADQCYCRSGYQGNQYLLGGCQDINECEVHPDICNGTGTCKNTVGSYKCKTPDTKNVIAGLGAGLGATALLSAGLWTTQEILKRSRAIKCRKMFFKKNGGFLLNQLISSGDVQFDTENMVFDSEEIEKVTSKFMTTIPRRGRRGSSVYKGTLADGKTVAVMASEVVGEENLPDFINEIIDVSQIDHENVVKLLGCCLETDVPHLIYEFVPNGTLYDHIHGQESHNLTWEMRLRIASEIAKAVSHLHTAASRRPIYHGRIQSSNVLLDENFRAKISDLGTLKSLAFDQTDVDTMVNSTFGYMDPEYFKTRRFMDKSDVYSFGVLMVELLTGEEPISVKRLEDGRSLATHFVRSLDENCLFDIIDPRIVEEGEDNNKQILAVANLAKRCLISNGRHRPTMKQVAAKLEAIQKSIGTCPEEQSTEEIENREVEIEEPKDYATTAEPQDYATTAEPKDYATTAEPQDYATTAEPKDYATTAEPKDYATTAEPKDYATTAEQIPSASSRVDHDIV